MGLKAEGLLPNTPGSKKWRKKQKANSQKTARVNAAPALEYDDGVSKDTGGRGKVKASKAPSLRQRGESGELMFTPYYSREKRDKTIRSPWRAA